MLAIDAPPKTKQKPNKVKIDENHPLMDLDKRLRHELDAFQEKIHAEIWGDVMDFLFGSHVFLTMPQILHLCHLAHANALHTLEDLKNNFWWNWMPDYGHTLLKLIHHIYGFKPSTTIVMTGSPRDRKALKGQQTWAQPLGWPLSHQVCWVVSEMVQGYHS